MSRRQRLLALILPLLLAVPAAAQSDLIGVYFDPDATYTCWDCIGPGQTLSAYLIMTELSAPPAAMQARVTYPVPPGAAIDLGFYPLGDIVWIAPPEDGQIFMGWSEPYPDPALVPVVEMRLMFLGQARVEFFVGPVHAPAIPGLPSYVTAEEPPRTLPLFPVSGSVDVAVGWVDTICDTCFPLADAASSWGAVKGLYR